MVGNALCKGVKVWGQMALALPVWSLEQMVHDGSTTALTLLHQYK